MPSVQVGHGFVIGIKFGVSALRLGLKAYKGEIVGREERFYRRNAREVLLDVKQEIAAFADREKFGSFQRLFLQWSVIESQEVLPALPNGVGAMFVASLGDECARGGNVFRAREL